MKVELRGDAARKIADRLASSDDPELMSLRQEIQRRLRTEVAVPTLTAAELDAVVTVLSDDHILFDTVDEETLVDAAIPKLKVMADRTRRKEELDAAAAERARG